MAVEVPTVCNWLLASSPRTVKCLERGNDLMVILGDSKRLGMKNVRLIVPEGILVYRCIRAIRNKGEFLFTVKEEGRDNSPAFLSVVLPEKGGALNYTRNAGILLDYPWYDSRDSSFAFDRAHYKGNLYLVNLAHKIGPHPFSAMKYSDMRKDI